MTQDANIFQQDSGKWAFRIGDKHGESGFESKVDAQLAATAAVKKLDDALTLQNEANRVRRKMHKRFPLRAFVNWTTDHLPRCIARWVETAEAFIDDVSAAVAYFRGLQSVTFSGESSNPVNVDNDGNAIARFNAWQRGFNAYFADERLQFNRNGTEFEGSWNDWVYLNAEK